MALERYPSAFAYVESLPDGLRSHPECGVRASVLRDAVEHLSPRQRPEALGSELDGWLAELPEPDEWLPEVGVQTVMLAVGDALGLDDDGYREFHRVRSLVLFDRPLYRVLMRFASPSLLLRRAPASWRRFHRGSELEVRLDSTSAVLELSYPDGLVNRRVALAFAGAYEAALERAGAGEPRLEVSRVGAGLARFSARW